MFTSLSSFSVFFFTVAAFLLIGIIFEEKFLQLEDKIDNYFKRKKYEKNQRKIREFHAQKQQRCTNKGYSQKNNRTTRNFAA